MHFSCGWNYLYLKVDERFAWIFARITSAANHGFQIPPPVKNREPGTAVETKAGKSKSLIRWKRLKGGKRRKKAEKANLIYN